MKRKHFLALLLALGLLFGCISCGTAEDRAAALQQTAQPTDAVTEPAAPPEDQTPAPTDGQTQASRQATAKPGKTTAPKQNGGGQDAQTPHTQAPAPTQKPAEAKIKVKVTVDCKTAVAKDDTLRDKFGSGSMVSRTVELEPGATVYDALKKAAGSVGVSGSYVYKIGGLSEGDCGAGSGWMYNVNGAYIQKSCKQQKLADGDVVQWRYTCNNGKDLGASV